MSSARVSISLSCAAGLLLLSGCGAVFINEGSKNATFADGLANPNEVQPKKARISEEAKVICNFDNGFPRMNSQLYRGADGDWSVLSTGGNVANSTFIVPGGADNTPMCAHVFGILMDHGDATNPTFTLQGRFMETGYYDASPFTGIKFCYKCPATDQALKRRLSIGTASTVSAYNGGSCAGPCNNYFGADLIVSPVWLLENFAFADLKQEPTMGAAASTSSLAEQLKELIFIRWDHSAHNTMGNYNIDYWVDEVAFY